MHDEQNRTGTTTMAAMGEIADAVLLAEGASDAVIAATGTLLSKAAANRQATGVPIMAAQRVLDQIERMMISQFDSRRALLAAHASLRAIARVAGNVAETGWGPDSECPQQATGAQVVELRSVA